MMLQTMVRRSVGLRFAAAPATRSFSGLGSWFWKTHDNEEQDWVEPPKEYTKDGAVIVQNVAFTLEWVLTSPPPAHAFEESPSLILRPDQED